MELNFTEFYEDKISKMVEYTIMWYNLKKIVAKESLSVFQILEELKACVPGEVD